MRGVWGNIELMPLSSAFFVENTTVDVPDPIVPGWVYYLESKSDKLSSPFKQRRKPSYFQNDPDASRSRPVQELHHQSQLFW